MINFNNPEYLPFYFLVLVPIIIHFIRFNQYKTIYYSNVSLLKTIQQETKKYNKLRDILLLIIRCLFILFLVSIFTQPHINKINNKNLNEESVLIYIDNSIEMSYPSKDGNTILEKVKEDLINLLNSSHFNPKDIYIQTNSDKNIYSIDKNRAKKEIFNLDYSYKNITLDNIFNRCWVTLNLNSNTSNNIILITTKPNTKKLLNTNFVQYKPASMDNISIKDVFVNSLSNEEKEINVIISSNEKNIKTEISIHLKNNDKYNFLSKKDFIIKNKIDTVSFFIDIGKEFQSGKVIIKDNISNVTYDDTFYFTIRKGSNKIVSIISNENNNKYLDKIFRIEEAQVNFQNIRNLNLSELNKSTLIVFDEIDYLDANIIRIIDNLLKEGKNISFIPNKNLPLEVLNNFTNYFQICNIDNLSEEKVTLEKINYSHNFFNSVFDKKLKGNYNFPFANTYYKTKNISSDILGDFGDSKNAIYYKNISLGSIVFFTFSFDKVNSNIYDHSLIIPLFYKSLEKSNTSKVYSILQEENINYFYSKSKNNEIPFIVYKNKKNVPKYNINSSGEIKIITKYFPILQGVYGVEYSNNKIGEISYNSKRNEIKIDKNSLEGKNINDIKLDFSNNLKSNIWNGRIFIIICLILLLLEEYVIKRKGSIK